MKLHCFVTGTDTGVGKTLVSSALLSSLAASGLRSVGMKPVAAGLDGTWRNDEALAAMEGLRARGIWVPAIRPPTVAEGTARLRIALSASHGEDDVARLVDALGQLLAQPWKEAA